jgi:hypothetical protein
MTDDIISRPSRTMAAAVSSQELSIPSTSILLNRTVSRAKGLGRVLLSKEPPETFGGTDPFFYCSLVLSLNSARAQIRGHDGDDLWRKNSIERPNDQAQKVFGLSMLF